MRVNFQSTNEQCQNWRIESFRHLFVRASNFGMNRCENTFPLQFGMVLICVGVTTPQLPPAPSSTANHTNRAERCTSAPALEPARFYVCKIGRDRIWTSSGIFSRNSGMVTSGFHRSRFGINFLVYPTKSGVRDVANQPTAIYHWVRSHGD